MARKKRKAAPDGTACVIYARFSSERQRDESIEDQVAVCAEWAAKHGLAVVRVYADRATSGTSDERPEFQRLVADAPAGAFGTVVVYKFDRFARNRFDEAIYRKRLKDLGVAVQSAMENIPEGPEGIILESVIAGYNEYYSRNLAQNTMRGMRGNAEKCLANGGNRLLGYRTGEDGRYEVDEREARIVRKVFQMAAAGGSRKEIVEWLRREGARTARGSEFSYSSLRGLIENERYTGVYIWGDVRVEGGMPAIVSPAVFAAAQTNRRRVASNSYPLSGVLFDEETGRSFRGTSGTSGSGKTYLYYSVPEEGGGERRYAKHEVEDVVAGALERAFNDPGVAESIARAAVEAIRAGAEGAAMDAMKRRLKEIERSQANMLKAVELGVIPDGAAERLEELRGERARIEESMREAQGAVPSVEELADWIRTRLCARNTDTLLRKAVSRVTVNADGIVRVEIPWSNNAETVRTLEFLAKKSGKRAGKSTFAEVLLGSPTSTVGERSQILLGAGHITLTGIVHRCTVDQPIRRE